MRRLALLLLPLGAFALAGCAALPWPGGRLEPRPPFARPDGWLDLRGVVHVHTRGSHDSPGTLEQVVAGARAAAVHWVAVTEHSRPGQPPPAGVVDGVTVIPGYELKAAGGTLLAVGVSGPQPGRLPAPELVRWVRAAGGVAFVSHLERSGLAEPGAYGEAGADGLELVNLHAAAEARRWRLALGLLFLPAPLALRTLAADAERNLAVWDALEAADAIVGSVDAHAKFRLLGRLGGTFDRYRDVFRLVTTHVLARDASSDAILDALRSGRSYVALEGLGRVDAFRFELRGDRALVEAPQEAELVLVCDGRRADEERATRALLALPPGARRCRAEAWLGKRLWIVTSYLEASSAGRATAPH